MFKKCKGCLNDLPANTDHYYKKPDTSDGFTIKCKVCMGGNYTSKLIKKPIDNHKFCIKCDRELPTDVRYFPPDKMCKDGLRNVCRECGKDGRFMEEGYISKKWWTKEEDEFFRNVYPHHTNDELINLYYPNYTEKELWDKAYRLGINGKTDDVKLRSNKQRSAKMSGENAPNFGKPLKVETRRKISTAMKGKYIGVNSYWFGKKRSLEQRIQMSRRVKGRWAGDKNPRHQNPLFGEENGRWQGGVTAENKKIRNSEEYKEWRNKVFERDNFTCQCCGEKSGDLESHHIENFSTNMNKRFDVDNGFTMCRKCHNPVEYNSFHYIYGCFNNTREQLDEYIQRYKNGEFKEMRYEHLLFV